MRGKPLTRDLDEARVLTIIEHALETAVKEGRLRPLLRGLLASRDRLVLAQRLRVAGALVGGHSYRGIRAVTGASFSTVSSVDRWLRSEHATYRHLFPIRHRRRSTVSRCGSDADKDFPGSAKGFARRYFGLSL